MHYSIEKVAALIGAHRYGSADTQIEWLLTDSRSLAFPETTLFFALRTRTGDGHRYIDDLYRRGVRNFVVSAVPWKEHDRAVADYGVAEGKEPPTSSLFPLPSAKLYPDANFLEVISPLKALQRLAERHREEYDVPVVGVTGSNGKTVVKEWIYQLLSPSQQVTRSPRSYNSQIGVPMSVWLLTEQSRVGIFEAGISQRGEMPGLRAIIQPTIGVMTNIGAAHQENFASTEEKCLEKLSLFDDAEVLVYCADDPIIGRCLAESRFHGRRFGWSRTDADAPLYITRAKKHADGTTIVFNGTEALLPFTDDASIENAINTIATGLVLGLTPETIAERLPRLAPVAMRLEVKQGVRGLTLINDSYNSDLTSLDIALDFLHRRCAQQGEQGTRRSVLVLSDLEQTGLDADTLYHRVAEMLQTRNVDVLVGIGENISQAHSLFSCEKHFFASTEELLASGMLETLHSDIVLLKGARSHHFDLIAEQLELKVHETVLEVNLGALAENVRYYRSFMQPETKLVCMVKASAYGSGSVEVARTLQDLGVDYLAVAVADEGVELRKAGITMGIIIMNPEMSSFHTLFKYRLEPEIYSFRLLDALVMAARKEGITNFPVHVKLDTGMCRLGFNPDEDIPALIERLQHQQALRVRSVFSHFVGSDSEDFNDFSQWQFERFDRASRQLQEAAPYHILRHICNSAGIARFPERHLDMCRLGIGLYGVDPVTNGRINNVTTLRTTILQIREIQTGTSVGYSRRTVVEKPSRIAAIPIGYADGLDRHLGNRTGYALVNGQKAPYVGNICMDVCMLDVTGIDCREGDSVEIFGDNLPVTVLSDLLGTIPYEVLTSVSERVKRVYFQ
ncbi:MAG: bifunctional UDP-N-acetylmuramoyl-tripeptide:D-alanyl-D-alanine ligase/alanine racemase [Bacteroidales bacterium]|nr:bifunctional UDP-N-acetylmuramoyl-tripeptide:D-alanyl-D-alanine ligase/alanine racemase [Bacteroidales bacterium]